MLVATFEANFNWKPAYENLRDALHPRFVHARTLARQVKFQVQMDDAGIADAHRYHAQGSAAQAEHLARLRSLSNGGLNEPLQSLPHYAWYDKVERFGSAVAPRSRPPRRSARTDWSAPARSSARTATSPTTPGSGRPPCRSTARRSARRHGSTPGFSSVRKP
ncbi:SRPBCC family protein [Xanthomonas graminis]|uniref:hypothetical protein n=1 Tax=Xanthomonas graminis TaxID=3390026 RepID=UPI002540AB98|nr:hypothetical protein [Xanthomonas translucens]